MAGSAFKNASVSSADSNADRDAIEARGHEIVSVAGDIILQMQDREVVNTREPVNAWLGIAGNDKEYPRVRVFALSAIDSVIGNMASAIHFSKQDAHSGMHDEGFSSKLVALSEQLVAEALAAKPLLESLDTIAQETSEPHVRSTAAEVRMSVGRSLAIIESHSGNRVPQAANNNASGAFPPYGR